MGKLLGKWSLISPSRCDDNIKTDVKEISHKDKKCSELILYSVKVWALLLAESWASNYFMRCNVCVKVTVSQHNLLLKRFNVKLF